MTLEEAKELLARIAEAERIVNAERRTKLREWGSAECAAGRHDWVMSHVVRPWCARCGAKKEAGQ